MEISYAKNLFELIYYITPSLKNNNQETILYDNVKVVQTNNFIRLISFFSAILKMFIGRNSYQTYELAKNKKFTYGFLKHVATHIFAAESLVYKANHIVKKHFVKDNVYVMSTWFSAEALAVALLQKKFPGIYTYSLAHSFEIDPNRNPFVSYSFNTTKHFYLKRITFISNLMRTKYLQHLILTKQLDFSKNTDVQYIGSEKRYEGLNSLNNDKFNICSCSGLNSVKRVKLIISALKHWEHSMVTWTHIGSGPLEQEVRIAAEELMAENQCVEVLFRGQLPNEEVQKYYTEHSVDLFINVSAFEGLPISIMEAMSYGIPVMATEVGGTSEIVNESNGVLLPKDVNPNQIYNKIYEFYCLPIEKKMIMRLNAYTFWKQSFDASKNIPEYFKKMLRDTSEN
jgi:glycosyltransferase involved in cell wall biosynthesis